MYDKMSLSVATPLQTWETPSTGSVTVCCMSNCFIFPKASQSSLTSLWLARMPLNGMPSSKCSQRIVWSEQTNLDYSVGTTCPSGILLEQCRLISWTHTDFEWIKPANEIPLISVISLCSYCCLWSSWISENMISMSLVYDSSSSSLSVFILHPDRSRSLDISLPGISK